MSFWKSIFGAKKSMAAPSPAEQSPAAKRAWAIATLGVQSARLLKAAIALGEVRTAIEARQTLTKWAGIFEHATKLTLHGNEEPDASLSQIAEGFRQIIEKQSDELTIKFCHDASRELGHQANTLCKVLDKLANDAA